MGQIIGPIDHATWFTMVQIRSSIKMLTKKVVDNPKHRRAIEQEKVIYKELLEEVLQNETEVSVQRSAVA